MHRCFLDGLLEPVLSRQYEARVPRSQIPPPRRIGPLVRPVHCGLIRTPATLSNKQNHRANWGSKPCAQILNRRFLTNSPNSKWCTRTAEHEQDVAIRVKPVKGHITHFIDTVNHKYSVVLSLAADSVRIRHSCKRIPQESVSNELGNICERTESKDWLDVIPEDYQV